MSLCVSVRKLREEGRGFKQTGLVLAQGCPAHAQHSSYRCQPGLRPPPANRQVPVLPGRSIAPAIPATPVQPLPLILCPLPSAP